ncbi:hypothetical protein [Planctomyces sp. SH-PL62]|uniref:hypothetical protein n=1 Tax=Planctomyces sp. SH-PL62 TaxID=1636152 RepID=UPI00078C8476|nr:hypothetical protein [Planctomyces sp. SH-PL62]AMV37688.1 hypothetical protein VT85_09645 [Planctomyces sp. SH-PL62]
MSRWFFGLAILLVVGGFGMVHEWLGLSRQVSVVAGLLVYAAGWLLVSVVVGFRTRWRIQADARPFGSEGDGQGRYAAFSRALAGSRRTGLFLMLVGAWLTPVAILGLFGLPILLAGAVACFIASLAIRRDGDGNAGPALGGVLLGLGWLLAAVAAMGVAHLVGDVRARGRDVPPLLPYWIAAPLLVGVGSGLRSVLGRRDRAARAAVVVGLLLVVAVLAGSTRGVLPRSL